jgi:hypothetical protein
MRPIQTVDDLQPMLDFYTGSMGEWPGKLMVALSFLADIEYTEGWYKVAPEARLSVDLAGALIGDVLTHIVAAQPEVNAKAEVEALLARWAPRPVGQP